MGTLGQDIRFALRNLRKSPSFTIIAAVTLALGIGASTAIFSVIENVLMEPFPYTDAARIVSFQIHDLERNEPGGRGAYSGPEFLDYVEQNHVFDCAASNDGQDVLYRSGEGTERFDGNLVTPGTFECLGMSPYLGRYAQPAVVLQDVQRDPIFVGKLFGGPRIAAGLRSLAGVKKEGGPAGPPSFVFRAPFRAETAISGQYPRASNPKPQHRVRLL